MSSAGRETSHIGRKLDPHPDGAVARLATKQHGVVSLVQLEAAGMSANAAQKRFATGRFHRVHRGVYAIGHAPLTHRGRCAAAVLACGSGSALSHTTAADLMAIAPSASPAIHITVPTHAGRSLRGLAVHRSSTLVAADLTTVDEIAVTNVARTLLDLAGVLGAKRLARAIEAADRLRLLDGLALERALSRAGRRPAAPRLRAALAAYTGDPAPVRSELERRALELFTQAGLPRPRVNTLVASAEGPLEVDFCWPDRRLVVEADSFEFHGTPAAFERDRRRDQLLKAAGWERLRITWRQVNEHPRQVVEAIASG